MTSETRETRVLSSKEHFIKNENCYVGKSAITASTDWIINSQNEIVYQTSHFIPKVKKLIQEGFSNTIDANLREYSRSGVFPKPTEVTVTENSVRFKNYSPIDLIPIEYYKPHGKNDDYLKEMLIPEIVFGTLYSSSNYDGNRDGIGTFGIGAKAITLFSSFLNVVVKSKTHKYTHKWKQGETISKDLVELKKTSKTCYVDITFDVLIEDKPYVFTETDILMIKKLVYDAAIFITNGIYFNNQLIQLSAKDYMIMHAKQEPSIVFKNQDTTVWMFFIKNNKTSSTLFTNGSSFKLTKVHTKSLTCQLVPKETLYDKVKSHILYLIVHNSKSLVFNDFQKTFTTDCLNIVFDNETIELFNKSEVMTWIDKINRSLLTKPSNITQLTESLGSPKMSHLILTEGESAKSNVIVGMAKNRKQYAVYAIRGKPTNITNVSPSMYGSDVLQLISVLGEKTFRYRGVIIMADPDPDGDHIAALLINTLYHIYKEKLSELPVYIFRTPVIRVSKKKKKIVDFLYREDFAMSEYNNSKYEIQYFKGLASYSKTDIQEFFDNIETHLLRLLPFDEDDIKSLLISFDTKYVAERRDWINTPTEPKTIKNAIKLKDFVDHFLKKFAEEDCRRSILSMMDGLKPVNRKLAVTLVYVKQKTKLPEIAASMSITYNYNHGILSAEKAGIEMGRDTNNNIRLCIGHGSFGNIINKTPGQSRYLSAEPSPLIKLLFPKTEIEILPKRFEDGHPCEPKYLIPPLPLILLIGKKGIGTGWATKTIPFDPLSLIRYLKKETDIIVPKMRNTRLRYFVGDMAGFMKSSHWKLHMMCQVYQHSINQNEYLITSLPIDMTVTQYLKFLTKKNISYVDESSDYVLIRIESDIDTLTLVEDVFMKASTANFTCMDENDKICAPNIEEICEKHKEIRLAFNEKKRLHILEEKKQLLIKKRNIYRFLRSGKSFHKTSLTETNQYFEDKKYDLIDNSYSYLITLSYRQSCVDVNSQLEKEIMNLENEIKKLEETTKEDMWNEDLDILEDYFTKECDEEIRPIIPGSDWLDLTSSLDFGECSFPFDPIS